MLASHDPILIDIYSTLQLQDRASADDILTDPHLRTRFLTDARDRIGDVDEREALQRLLYLRKRSRLPRGKKPAAAN